jgi:uncharacterized protein YeaO (DUF488 family)
MPISQAALRKMRVRRRGQDSGKADARALAALGPSCFNGAASFLDISKRPMTISLKRVYGAPAKGDGFRILVDRLWPRGIAKAEAKVDLWLKEIAPSNDLRKRFHGHPEDWAAFKRAYFAELKSPEAAAAAKELRRHLRKGPVTLLYAARDDEPNNAVALAAWLRRRGA